jgi:hypothetical protein
MTGKVFFFEKKKQKTFDCAVAEWPEAWAIGQKFFGSFFQKKNILSSYAIVGITKLAPAFTPGVQRCVTVLVRV